MATDIYTTFGIDKSKLKRDYIKNPIKKKQYIKNGSNCIEYELINYDDLKYLYITCKLSSITLGKYLFNINPKVVASQIKKYNLTKDKKTYFEDRKYNNTLLYGVDNVMKINTVKEKMYFTNIKKYGCKSSIQNEIVKNKQYLSKKKNNTFNTSSLEEQIYKLLKEKYDIVLRQYKTELYPFRCDFYIPKIDTYIEYQGFKSHNYEPFINSMEQKNKVNKWKKLAEYNKAYNGYLKVWTITDPLKREIAKRNNLNWFEFFNMKQFMEWYNKIKEV